MSRSRIPKALRAKVAAQARYRCGYCLTAESIVGTSMELDHLIPEALGGPSRRLGLDPGLCLVIEDAVAGVAAARAAGSRCLGITTSFEADRLIAAGAEWTAPSLAAAPSEALVW
jgi:hypothetical protein